MSLSQPIASICFFSSSVRYFSASFFSHSSGISALLHGVEQAFQPLEHGAEDAVELVEVALVLHQRGAGEIVEILDRLVGEIGVERLHQRQIFAQGHRDLRVAQRCEELQEHGIQIARRTAHVKGQAHAPKASA